MDFRETDPTARIRSGPLRLVAKHLLEKGCRVTFYGRAWTGNEADWIYFDCALDLEELRREFALDESIVAHENLDPKSGTERGLVDSATGEGLMGKIP